MPNVSAACKAARISNPAAWYRRKHNPEFARQWEEALQAGVEGLEEATWDRAKEGVEQWTWAKDKRGRFRKLVLPRAYSDGLATFLLKAHRPDKYRESYKAEISGPDGQPIAIGNTAIVIAWPHDTQIHESGNYSGNGGNGGNGAIAIEATASHSASAPPDPD